MQVGDTLGVLQNAARELPPVPLPDTLAGLPRRTLEGAPPAIGIYGRGITVLAVVPLPRGVAGDLRRAAEQDPNAVTDDLGSRLTAGPLGILLVAGIAAAVRHRRHGHPRRAGPGGRRTRSPTMTMDGG